MTQNSTIPDITHKQHTNRIQDNAQTGKEVTEIEQTRAKKDTKIHHTGYAIKSQRTG